ncbi:mannose-1-phosphate guanylyltransferase/mannose-6-phosphate isomerase [Sporomusa malonica]|uniref:mannose-1-phosphate guanylyltransferase n=1 Tax=Sporomusa malonica TaxID=112901 RepID=A0A1W2EPA1_9FIRM|nr:mannose-1-phosphate guanylyltransferase/mannose-6-phosphate isomerase [Sporomusa malonica]SMD11372.1 mannose-1-phosphate guanylyltransferase / mannose-6-phosphate isomerase [Sporomusa malonica]
MKVIILAGGGGSRLFPLSRTLFPKQFLKLNGEESLLAQTIARFLPLVKPADMVVVTNQEYVHLVRTELIAAKAQGAHILLEPVARNTAPAVAFAAKYCLEQLGCEPDEILYITPSDHIIRPIETFTANVRQVIGLAKLGKVVTLGIPPNHPETGYGYIQVGKPFGGGFAVQSFREKPNQQTAEAYLAAGSYYWNSGMFAFTIHCLMDELQAYQPAIYELAESSLAEMTVNFTQMPNISLDYAIAEKSEELVMLPITAEWNDIGSWDAIYDVLDKDADGNAVKGDCMPIECSNTLILGHSRLIAGIGLEDILVVETDDVIVVAKKGESQKVKDLVGELKAKGRVEADEHTTVYRPWGFYTVLGSGPGYKMKKIVVNSGEILSLQMHYHRSEHWIVIGGTAKVTIGDTEQMVHENESIFVPQTTKHRLENPGKLPLQIIEVQNGSYLGEDDIVRFNDRYGRS